jgi:hypothetical protein
MHVASTEPDTTISSSVLATKQHTSPWWPQSTCRGLVEKAWRLSTGQTITDVSRDPLSTYWWSSVMARHVTSAWWFAMLRWSAGLLESTHVSWNEKSK